MSEKGWKLVERKVAELLGGRRIPVSGRQRGDAPDVEHDSLSLEVKSRKSIPTWLTGAMEQADASSRDGKLPVAVLHEQGKLYTDALCVMRLEDLADCLRGSQSRAGMSRSPSGPGRNAPRGSGRTVSEATMRPVTSNGEVEDERG